MSIQLARVNFALGKQATTPWLETITSRQIAMLLTWTGDTTKKKEQKRDYSLWINVIEAACQRGELASTAVTETKDVYSIFDMVYGHDGYVPQYREVTSYHIKPQDAARWLEGQGHPPGELLKAWFKSQGVDTEAVVIAPAPAKKEPVSERNARWLKLWDEENPGHASGSQARAIEKIVSAEGVKAETVKKALQTAEKDRDEERRDGKVSSIAKKKKTPASPLPSTKHRIK